MLRCVLDAGMWLILGNLVIGCIAAQDSGAEYFEKNIRPILAQSCLGCHSGSNQPMAGLVLDGREGLLKGGGRGPAIVAGDPGQSLLIRAVRQVDEHLKMPPAGKLKEAEVAALAEWVRMGAPWGVEPTQTQAQPEKKYWAFVLPKQVRVPDVRNSWWVKSPVDAFVLAALETKALAPAPPADRRTLIRRATFDLSGLPPTPEEIRAFLDDSSPDAFARVIDRLLASPRYGERWGRHWLDVARYADSNGLDENLVYRNAFRYRDYVIQALNKDKPYDQFVQEQLAGDLLPGANDLATKFERYAATGFLSLGAKMLAEDDPVKMEMDIVDEQLDTTARTFMGLTVGCARCHDHKFDPIPQADYYSMAGIFKSTKTMENFKVVAKWHEYVLAPKEDLDRLKAHEDKIKAKQSEISRITKADNTKLVAEAREKAGAYLLAADDVLRYERIRLKPIMGGSRNSSGAVIRDASSFDLGNVPRKLEKENANVPKDQTGSCFAEYVITLPSKGDYQIDILEQEAGHGTPDILVNGVLMRKGAPPVQNRAASPDAGGWSVAGIFPFNAGRNTIRLEQKTRFSYFEKLLAAPSPLAAGETEPKTLAQVARRFGVNPGFLEQWVEEMGRSKGAPHSILFAWFAFGAGQSNEGWTSPAARLFRDFKPKTREQLAERYQEFFLDAMKKWQALEATRKKEPEPENDLEENKAAQPKEAGLADDALEAIRAFLYEKAGVFRAPVDSKQYFAPSAQEQLTRMEADLKALEATTPDFPRAMGVQESAKIADLAIHLRGSHWTLGKQTPRRFLRVIAGENQTPIGSQESGRLQLARWITQPDHPLTSRVMVNRIWRWHFGRGIVPSTDNFGRLGEQPSNQPLLDWLALQFVQHGWSVKEMHRLLMLTNAYQMSSAYNERSYETDPENILLWRMPRRRLEAEAIRDAIMSVSGDLDLSMGGSILKYKDRQYVTDTTKGGDIDYDLHRRAVYIPVVRSSMYDVFQAFDLPDPSTANGDRTSTVVAPQALFMMNGSVLLKHSLKMAEVLLARADLDDAGRIREAYERALGRPPAPKEIDGALTLIAQVSHAMESRQPDERGRRVFAWQSFCKSLFASNEFIYLN